MSYYTNDIETHEIQAYTNSTNFRTEFRLDADKLYMSNMRLMNIGFKENTAVTRNVNRLVGAYGIIKSLSLFDDNELIDSLDNFNLWAGFSCYNKKNDDNLSTNYFLKKNNMGQVSQGTNPSQNAVVDVVLADNTADNVTGARTWFDVSAYLDFLKQSKFVPTHYFKRLRLVIEYETDVKNLTPNHTDPVSSLEPFLIVDEMKDPDVIMNVLKNYGTIQYQPIESSRVVMPVHPNLPTSSSEGAVQEVTFTIQGFNNKSINRLVMMPVGQSVESTKYGKIMATAVNLNNFQVRTSEGNLLQGQGITLDNQRRKMLSDLYGDCNDQVGAVWVQNANTVIANDSATLGFLEPFAVKLEQEMVQNFQVTLGRKSVYDASVGSQNLARYNQILHLHFFAEVVREIVVNPKDMSYSISYV